MRTRQVVLTALVAALLAAQPLPAAAAPGATPGVPSGVPSGATPADRVRQLTAEYERHTAAAEAAAADLTRAYAATDAAEAAADRSAAGASAIRAQRAAHTLALYAYGVDTNSALTLLTADSPEDGLWRLAVGVPLAQRVTASDAAADRVATARAATDAASSASVEQAARQLSAVLGRLRSEQESARLSLEAARAELARLDAAARRERQAAEAAAELARAQSSATGTGLRTGTPMSALSIPADYERAYHDAATTCPGMPWTLLAAVGQVESGHGRNNGPSSAGAIGPMQFMPATFASYGVDGDHDGTKDAWDPQDAIFSAARYLCTSGAGDGPAGVQRALFAYNHAQWYVDLVLSAQRAIIAAHPS